MTMDTNMFLLRALMCASTISLGALPISLVGEMTDIQMGTCISVAAGMMSGCAVVMAIESLLTSSWVAVLVGMLLGAAVIHMVQWLFSGREDLSFADLKGSSATGAVVIFVSMVLHSFGEGLSIGVSATQAGAEDDVMKGELNLVVLGALAIHNIPEGMAICMAYRSKGMSIARAAILAWLTNLPQPLSALASFGCMRGLGGSALAIPVGLGAASGAMLYVVCRELAPEALEKIPTRRGANVMLISGLLVLVFDAWGHFGSYGYGELASPLGGEL
jgi:zinc transporter ZupT